MQIKTTKASNGFVVETIKKWKGDSDRFYREIYVAKNNEELCQIIGEMFLKELSVKDEYSFELP